MIDTRTLSLPDRELEVPIVIHADTTIVVIDKPAGMLAVPGRSQPDCAWARMARRFDDARVVHRIDQATSGLMLLARGLAMQRALGIAFARRQVDKRYEAVVHGLIERDEGRIDAPLAADWPNRPRQRVDPVHGKPALTLWRVIRRDAVTQRTRVVLTPVTGRSHQLRVHMSAIGHPIVGDALYAAGPNDANEPRMLLHAVRLEFDHPHHATRRFFDCPAPY